MTAKPPIRPKLLLALATLAVIAAGWSNNWWRPESKSKTEKEAFSKTYALTRNTGSSADNISGHWFGSYSIDINYAKVYVPSAPPTWLGYDIGIQPDSCTFLSMGYMTFYEYLCKTKENRNELHLLYLKIIDGFHYGDISPLDTIATLIRDAEQYYIKSPIIHDTGWEPNKKLPLNKR